MGIYDRGYYREDPPPGLDQTWNGKSPIAMIIIICVASFILNLLFRGQLSDVAALQTQDLWKPWMWWRSLTYGFVHDRDTIGHIFFNMFALWMLGRSVEERYGWSEFWRIYIVALIFCGLIYLLGRNLAGGGGSVVGASGAVLAVTMLFVFNYPRNILMLFGVVPIPAWGLGLAIVLGNLLFIGGSSSRTAYDVHLAGIAFAAIYYYGNLNFNLFGDARMRWKFWKRKTFGPKLKTFDGDAAEKDATEADRILEKIQRSGLDSLTSKERKFMEKYSAKVRQKQNTH